MSHVVYSKWHVGLGCKLESATDFSGCGIRRNSDKHRHHHVQLSVTDSMKRKETLLQVKKSREGHAGVSYRTEMCRRSTGTEEPEMKPRS